MRTIFNWRNLANAGRGGTFRDYSYSPTLGTSIWEMCPQLAALDPAVAIQFFEDFISVPLDDATRNPLGYNVITDTATDAITLPKVAGGVLDLATGGVDNNETYIQLGGSTSAVAAPFVITDANSKPFFFEVYAKALQHADEAIFIGLAEEGACAANFLTDNSGVPVDKDYIGFRYKTDAPTEWDVAWKKAGQAEQEIAAVAVNADDFHRFGFVFDGLHTVTFYIDRVAHATVALTSAATFPSAQQLAPIFAVKTGAGAASHVQVDYFKIFQVR